jgi:hypothetical protein
LVSLTAASFFTLAAANPHHPNLHGLMVLNMVLYTPTKLISFACASYRALRTPNSDRGKANPLKTSLNAADTKSHQPMVLVIVPCHGENVARVLESIKFGGPVGLPFESNSHLSVI